MTKEERETFIKEKIVPLFEGMKASDVYDITRDNLFILTDTVFENLILTSEKKPE